MQRRLHPANQTARKSLATSGWVVNHNLAIVLNGDKNHGKIEASDRIPRTLSGRELV